MTANARPEIGRLGNEDPSRRPHGPHVLLAEDDTRMRELIAATLRRDGFEVTELRDGAELLDWYEEVCRQRRNFQPVDLIITDLRMPTRTGLEVLMELREGDWAVPVILITAFGDEATHQEARRLGAAAIFDKPFDLDDLRTAARYFAGTGET